MKNFQPDPRILGGIPPKALQGGIQLQKVPVIPWEGFVACGLKVFDEQDKKVKVAIFDPQPMDEIDEAFQTLRLLIAAQSPKPGPVDWATVPEEVTRHFKIKDAQ